MRQRRRTTILIVVLAAATLSLFVIAGQLGSKEHGMRHRKWKSLAAVLGLAGPGVIGSGAKATLPVPPTTIGLNLSPLDPFRRDRAFANLAVGGVWQSTQRGSAYLTAEDVDSSGNLKRLPGDRPVVRALAEPGAQNAQVAVRCTWDGKGDAKPVGKGVSQLHLAPNGLTFQWSGLQSGNRSGVLFEVLTLNASDPLRNLDCREVGMPRDKRFDPAFLQMLRGFSTLRFMDWQNVNHNLPVTWAGRHPEGAIDASSADGVSIEDMLALAKEADADPWFNMPWNADDDYVEHFARLVHDRLPAGHRVYVEVGNEVWNARFPVSKQALAEGTAEGLSNIPDIARLNRYSEKLAHVLDIWARVFADKPSRLVRVVNSQNGPSRSKLILEYKDTARHIDALATAPYFSGDFHNPPPGMSLDTAFAAIESSMTTSLDRAARAKEVAAKYGKRYIAYEAGQGVALRDLDLLQRIERDPRMHDIYARYLAIWREQIGDLITMYVSVHPIVRSGGWGLLEYHGQPLSEAPKMRAVREAIEANQARR